MPAVKSLCSDLLESARFAFYSDPIKMRDQNRQQKQQRLRHTMSMSISQHIPTISCYDVQTWQLKRRTSSTQEPDITSHLSKLNEDIETFASQVKAWKSTLKQKHVQLA